MVKTPDCMTYKGSPTTKKMEVKDMMQSCSIFLMLSEDSFKDFSHTNYFLSFFYVLLAVELQMMHVVVVNRRKYS